MGRKLRKSDTFDIIRWIISIAAAITSGIYIFKLVNYLIHTVTAEATGNIHAILVVLLWVMFGLGTLIIAFLVGRLIFGLINILLGGR